LRRTRQQPRDSQRLSPLGARVETALRERLAEAPSFVAFEGYDTVAVLADVLRSHGSDRARIADPGRASRSKAPAGRSSSLARPASAFGSGPGRQPKSWTGIRQNPTASESCTPPERKQTLATTGMHARLSGGI
jgi:hypothetical protein